MIFRGELNMTNKDSDKRFDEMFVKHGVVYRFNRNKGETEFWTASELKSFLHQELDRAREEAYGEGWSDCAKNAREDIRDNYMPRE